MASSFRQNDGYGTKFGCFLHENWNPKSIPTPNFIRPNKPSEKTTKIISNYITNLETDLAPILSTNMFE